MLSNEQYVFECGRICPDCRHHDVRTNETQKGVNVIYQDCTCSGCGATWTDEYKLSGYDNFSDNMPKTTIWRIPVFVPIPEGTSISHAMDLLKSLIAQGFMGYLGLSDPTKQMGFVVGDESTCNKVGD